MLLMKFPASEPCSKTATTAAPQQHRFAPRRPIKMSSSNDIIPAVPDASAPFPPLACRVLHGPLPG